MTPHIAIIIALSIVIGATSTLIVVLCSRPCRAWLTLRREGMDRAVLDVADLLDGHGLQKHGVRRWRKLTIHTIRAHCIRHLEEGCFDRDPQSGQLHAVHGAARALQLVDKTRAK